MRYILLLILIALASTQTSGVCALEQPADEEDFFTFRKYKATYKYFTGYQRKDLGDAGAAARQVQRMGTHLVRGFDLLQKDKPEEALAEFKKSARTVPEYFHADFIIALTYDRLGDAHNAARYYRSYLKKLEKFWDGLYRLTSPVIIKTVDFDIPGYAETKERIARRMAASGIDMKTVSSEKHPLPYVILVLAAVFGVTAYAAIRSKPVRRAGYRIKAMLDGRRDRWICRNCGKQNSNVNIVCWSCGVNK